MIDLLPWGAVGLSAFGGDAHAQTDHTAPVLDEATVEDGAILKRTYDETLDTASIPAAGDFTVRVRHLIIDNSSVTVSGSEVILRLIEAVPGGPDGEIDDTQGTSPIRVAAANAAVALDGEDVDNEGDLPVVSIAAEESSVTEDEELGFTLSRTGPTLIDLDVGLSSLRSIGSHQFSPKLRYRIPAGSAVDVEADLEPAQRLNGLGEADLWFELGGCIGW